MIKTVEAVIDECGNVRVLESVDPGGVRRAVVIILEERPMDRRPAATARLSETALAGDWDRPEEDEAWELPAKGAVVLVLLASLICPGRSSVPQLYSPMQGAAIACSVRSLPDAPTRNSAEAMARVKAALAPLGASRP